MHALQQVVNLHRQSVRSSLFDRMLYLVSGLARDTAANWQQLLRLKPFSRIQIGYSYNHTTVFAFAETKERALGYRPGVAVSPGAMQLRVGCLADHVVGGYKHVKGSHPVHSP